MSGGSALAARFGLRRAVPGDRAALEALQRAAYAKNRPLLGVEPLPLLADYGEIMQTMEVWCVGDGSRLAGALILERRPDDLLIWSIATDPAEPASGLGRRLLAAAEARAAELGRTTVRLYTGTPLKHLVAWYGRHGYSIERVEQMPDRSITHMLKQVGPLV